MKLLFISAWVIALSLAIYAVARKNESTHVNHTGGPILINVKCFHHPEEAGEDLVVAPNDTRDVPMACPDREDPL